DLPLAIDFIPQTPVLHIERLFRAVFSPQVREVGIAGAVAILHPVRRLFRRARSEVYADIRLSPKLAAIGNELVCAEVVAFFFVPRGVISTRPEIFGTNTIHPVIAGRKVSTGPAKHWNPPALSRVQNIFAKAILVRER